MQEMQTSGRSVDAEPHQMQRLQEEQFLRADDIGRLVGVDRSTVYRMAEQGALPGVKIGRQWRFRREDVERLLHTRLDQGPGGPALPVAAPPTTSAGVERRQLEDAVAAAQPLLELSAEILGVMLVVTDMEGRPFTEVINPCRWFREHGGEPDVLNRCLIDWKELTDDADLGPRFHIGSLQFDCARAYIRIGRELVGMVLAGGLARSPDDPRALYRLSTEGRTRVLETLPQIAARLSQLAANVPSNVGTRRFA